MSSTYGRAAESKSQGATRQAASGLRQSESGEPLGSELERKFDTYWRAIASDAGFPPAIPQYQFGRYVLDLAWPQFKVAVELNGGAGGGYGRRVVCHNCGAAVRARRKDGSPGKFLSLPYPSHSGQGAERDARKHNALQEAGWSLLVFTSHQVDSDPHGCIEAIIRELKKAQLKASATGRFSDSGRLGDDLSAREVEVLELFAQGLTADGIAERLGVSKTTVITHATHLREKLGAPTITAAAVRAMRMGIID